VKITRAQLAKFCPDNETIRAFEDLALQADSSEAKIGQQIIVGASSAADTTLVTAASVPVGIATYRFEFFAVYSVASTAAGTRWTLDGPAAEFVVYTSRYSLSATATTTNNCNAYSLPAGANASSADGNICMIDGIVKPTANGTLSVQFASGGASAVNLLSGHLRLIRLT
jgi:hypothetical protein